MAEAQRRLLPCEAGLPGAGQVALESIEFPCLAAFGERAIKFEVDVEMILDHRLAAPRHEYEMLDTGGLGLIDGVLDHGTVHHGQHLLGDGFRGGQEPRAEAGDGEYSFAKGRSEE